MTWQRRILVVADVTGTLDDGKRLAAALRAHVGTEPTTFRLIVPATPFTSGRMAAPGFLSETISRLEECGLTADGFVGDSDPLIAVNEAWDPSRYDEIVISMLPTSPSKWLHAGLPERIANLTGARVTHHVYEPVGPAVETEPAAMTDRPPLLPRSPLVPLSVLSWAGGPSPPDGGAVRHPPFRNRSR
jgi:hypothetical protein